MWLIIMWTTLAITGAALVYVSNRVCQFGCIKRLTKGSERRKALIGGGLVFGIFGIIGLIINFMNAIVCIIYFALIWLLCDLCFWLWQKYKKQSVTRYYSGGMAIVLSLAALVSGWYLDHHVWLKNYELNTEKMYRR